VRLNFVVDTGSERTIIDQRLAKRLKPPGLPVHLAAVNTSIPVPESMAASFEIGPVRIDPVRMLVRDLGFLRKLMGRRIDVILGLDVLARQSFSIDYRRRNLLLGDCMTAEFQVPFSPNTSLLAVPAQVQGDAVTLLVDTGASDTQLFARKMTLSGPVRKRKAYGIAGGFNVKEVELASLRLGSEEVKTPPHAFIVDGKSEETQDFDGLLSPAALGISRMCMDMKHGVFSWSR
jgi:predicted aspartyl protease